MWEEHLLKEREQRIKQEADIGPNMVEVPVQQLSKAEEMNDEANSDNKTKG